MEVNIRPAIPADLADYTQLLQRAYQSAYVDESIGLTADLFSPEIFSSADTQKYLAQRLTTGPGKMTWLAFLGEKLAGSVTCVLESDDIAEIAGFYVDPEHQGKGIGTRLYSRALDFAGDRDLVLDLYCHNTNAISMYSRWGWVLDTSRGEKGYFSRHWPEWPESVRAKCMYMIWRNPGVTKRKNKSPE